MVTITVTEPVRVLLEHALGRFIGGPQRSASFTLTVSGHTFTNGELVDAYDAVADAPRNGLRPFLDLSTMHLKPSTREMWRESFNAEHFPNTVLVGEHGWMMCVPTTNDGWDYRLGVELHAIFDHAREIGAQYLLFDTDGPDIEGLPYFDDGEEPADDDAGPEPETPPFDGASAAPFDFTPDHDAFIQALKVQNFDATHIAPLLSRRAGALCSRTDVAVRLAELATAEAAHG